MEARALGSDIDVSCIFFSNNLRRDDAHAIELFHGDDAAQLVTTPHVFFLSTWPHARGIW